MGSESATFLAFQAIRARVVSLEHDIYTWTDVLHQYQGQGDAQKTHHAEFALAAAQKELAELRMLLAYWEAHNYNGNGRKEISSQFAVGIIAVYGFVILAILFYLVALVGRNG